jgi:hypothetical protein
MTLEELGRRVRKSDRSGVQFTGNWSPRVRTPFIMFGSFQSIASGLPFTGLALQHT